MLVLLFFGLGLGGWSGSNFLASTVLYGLGWKPEL